MKLRLAACALLVSAAALAQQKELISGPGAGLTNEKCSMCHDNEHIARSKLTREEWDDNLRNMVKRGMAALSAEETRVIIDYLATYYGPNPPPAPSPDTLAAGGDDPVAKLLAAHACSACHAIDKRGVGPGFREVAAKYAGDGAAAARLAAKIRAGGQGVWGAVPMPPNAAIADADLKMLVAWVLGRK